MSEGFTKILPIPNYLFPLNNNSSYNVKILTIDKPNMIYVLPVEANRETSEFLLNIRKYFDRRRINPCKGIVSSKFDLERSLCIVKFQGQIYRGHILTWIESIEFKILLVDYGQTIIVDNTQIHPIPEDLANIPFRAHPLKLAGIKMPKNGWTSSNYRLMHQLLLDEEMIFKLEINNEGLGVIKNKFQDINSLYRRLANINNQLTTDEQNKINKSKINKIKITESHSKQNNILNKTMKKQIKIHEKIEEENAVVLDCMSFNKYNKENDKIESHLLPENISNSKKQELSFKQNSFYNLNKTTPSCRKDEVCLLESNKDEIQIIINCLNNEKQKILETNEKIPSCGFAEEIPAKDSNSEGASYISPTEMFCSYPCGTIVFEESEKDQLDEKWDPIKQELEEEKSSNNLKWPFKDVCANFLSKRGCLRKHCRFPHVDIIQANKQMSVYFKTFNQMHITQFEVKLKATVDSVSPNGALLIHLNNYVFDDETLDTLIQNINICDLKPLKNTPGAGELVLAKYNSVYYRAQILELFDNQAKLFLIDIGLVIQNFLYELRGFQKNWLHYPPQALECYLYDVELIKDSKNLENVKKLIVNKSVLVVFKKSEYSENRYWIQLFDDEDQIDINNFIINLGLGIKITDDHEINSRKLIFIPG